MEKFKSFLQTLGLLNEDQCVSITNLVVFVFLFITSFKALFAGVVIDCNYFDWKIESLDLSSTLPLLFSLLNYHGKRVEVNKLLINKENSDAQTND